MSNILNFIKDAVISIIILACIVLLFVVIFYDKISITKAIPEADYYTLTKEMQEELDDTNIDKTEEVVINYHIDAKDLKKYEKNNEYDKGKSDPFSAVIDIHENTNAENGNSNSSSTNTNNNTTNNNSGFYEDDGTK